MKEGKIALEFHVCNDFPREIIINNNSLDLYIIYLSLYIYCTMYIPLQIDIFLFARKLFALIRKAQVD